MVNDHRPRSVPSKTWLVVVGLVALAGALVVIVVNDHPPQEKVPLSARLEPKERLAATPFSAYPVEAPKLELPNAIATSPAVDGEGPILLADVARLHLEALSRMERLRSKWTEQPGAPPHSSMRLAGPDDWKARGLIPAAADVLNDEAGRRLLTHFLQDPKEFRIFQEGFAQVAKGTGNEVALQSAKTPSELLDLVSRITPAIRTEFLANARGAGMSEELGEILLSVFAAHFACPTMAGHMERSGYEFDQAAKLWLPLRER